MNINNQTDSSQNPNQKNLPPRAESNMRPEAYSHTHERKIISIVGNRLLTSSSDGREHSYNVTADAQVTCDGVVCATDQLKVGASIRITAKPNDRSTAVKIESFQDQIEITKPH